MENIDEDTMIIEKCEHGTPPERPCVDCLLVENLEYKALTESQEESNRMFKEQNDSLRVEKDDLECAIQDYKNKLRMIGELATNGV